MRIVLLNNQIPPEGRGGAERISWGLAQGLAKAGHDVSMIVSTPDPSFADRREGIQVHHLHAGYPLRWQGWLSLYNPQTVPAIRDLFRRIVPDVVHFHNVHLNLSYESIRVAHRLGLPTVFTAHDLMSVAYGKLTHWIDPARCGVADPGQYRLPRFYNFRQMRLRYNPFRNPVIRSILTHAIDVRICVGKAQQQALAANGLPGFVAIPNGLDPHAMAVLPDQIVAVRDQFGLNGHRVILFAGRMGSAKGSVQMLRALETLIDVQPEALLFVLSDKPIAWESDAQRSRLAPYVRLAGWLDGDQLRAAYHAADVVTVPSICLETFSMVAVEAMAASKPVVATCYGGPAEIVIDGATGYVVNPFDADQFADRLHRLLRDQDLAARFGAAGRQRLIDHFTLNRHVTAYEQAYREAIAAHSI